MKNIETIIEENGKLFDKPNVVSVKAGLLFRNGWVTDQPAIVVKVAKKVAESALLPEQLLPSDVEGIPVDVVMASPLEMTMPEENDVEVQEVKLRLKETERLWKPMDGNPINITFELKKGILCHASPDAGWPELKKFLAKTKHQLTAAMFDFNADYIARDVIVAAKKSNAKVNLLIDPNQNAEELRVQSEIDQELKDGFDRTLASVGKNKIFETAYHEKVLVRDSESFWLSSGNWSLHSLPDVDPWNGGSSGNIYATNNRDWHVIIDDTELAKTFEDYILFDIKNAKSNPPSVKEKKPDVLVPQNAFLEMIAAQTNSSPLHPETLPKRQPSVTVQPLLTPDNYIEHIIDLIGNCSKSLYLQFQYIHLSKNTESDKEFIKLMDLIKSKTNDAHIDCRIIISQREAREWITKYHLDGFNTDCFRVQAGVHNKGLLIDDAITVVGSHNWSAAGALRNRDASLIIYNDEINAYYKKLFLDDWEFRAYPDVFEQFTPVIARTNTPTPPGWIRLPWSAVYD